MMKMCFPKSCKISEGGHRRICSDPYPLGNSKRISITHHTSSCGTLRLCMYMFVYFFSLLCHVLNALDIFFLEVKNELYC